MSGANANEFSDLAALFDGHIEREFADQDVNATMETMERVRAITGGRGARIILDPIGGTGLCALPGAAVSPGLNKVEDSWFAGYSFCPRAPCLISRS